MSSSEENRYSFHAQARSTLANPGVTPDFVHSEIIRPLAEATKRLSTVASINPNSTGTQQGLDILNDCVATIESALSVNPGLNKSF